MAPLAALSLLLFMQPPPQDLQKLIDDLVKPKQPGQILIPPLTLDETWKEALTIDFDSDGVGDLVVEYSHGRGPLSTYYSTFRLRGINGVGILRGGEPLAKGTKLTLADLPQASQTCTLCTIGNSLRYPNESFEKFSGGTWWKKEKAALGIVVIKGAEVRFGYILLTVSAQGEVTAHSTHLEKVVPSVIEVK